MNTKRAVAIIGLICMAVCILSMVVSGIFPALQELLSMLGLIAFLIAVSISLFFYFRKKEAEADQENQAEEEKTE